MEIVFTRRIVEYLYQLHENFQRCARLGMLAQELEGMQIDENSHYNLTPIECQEAFKRLIMDVTGFTEEEFDKTLYPLRIMSGKEFSKNPYLQNITIEYYKEENIILTMDVYSKESLHSYDETIQDSALSQKFQYAIFDEDVIYYYLGTEDFVWMSIAPSEINSMKKGIRNAKGRVLVLGGGLGYFPYMCSLKSDVSSITIVEKDPIIKNILAEQIIPQFGNDKVSIIEADAYDFMENDLSGKYDSVFADIWENNIAGQEHYQKLVRYEDRYPEIHFDYWLEDNILSFVVDNIFIYFMSKMTPENEKLYAVQYPLYYNYLENISNKIERPEQMQYYLNRRFAKEMLKSFKE